MLVRQGDLDGAAACYRKAIGLDPKLAQPHNKLGLLLRDQGKLDEAIAEFREAVRLEPNAAWNHDQLGWSLRLQGKLDEALTRCKKAVALQPREANFHNSLAYVLWDQGRLDEAIAEFREAVRLDPHFAPASSNLAEVERMAVLQDKLPALQKGEFKPRTSDELHAMARLCQIKKLFLASARMYADAFADDPKLADDLKTSNRYDAACWAALAGAGQGKDDPPPDETKKADLRRQALTWLRADLALLTKQLDSDKPEDRKTAVQTLRHWQQDADLSGLRDADGAGEAAGRRTGGVQEALGRRAGATGQSGWEKVTRLELARPLLPMVQNDILVRDRGAGVFQLAEGADNVVRLHVALLRAVLADIRMPECRPFELRGPESP